MSLDPAPQRYTVTAALPYANGPIHVGHLAGVYLPADIYVRYLRRRGHQVVFVSGSDEGGAAITLQARKEGLQPQELADKYHAANQQVLQDFGISFDSFVRTSSAAHHQEAQAFFLKLHAQGLLEKHTTAEYYDPTAQLFLADRYIQGSCPRCAYEAAYGDQCEGCGAALSPEELQAPRSKITGTPPIRKATTHWYLPLQRDEAWLKQWILEDHQAWRAHVYGQCRSWLNQGLQARTITRDLAWGVPVPLPAGQGKVLYVWFEAPIAYITATKLWAQAHQQDWRPFWQDPATKLVHFLGKDNIVFHCLIFPAMLRAHGGYILPTHVPANAFMHLEGQKISTSRQHAVWLHDYLAEHPGKQDVLRYVLCANAPETGDSNFTWQDFREKNNSELVGILGNFVHRTLVLVHTHFEGKVPQPSAFTALDRAVSAHLHAAPTQIGAAIEACTLRQALQEYLALARAGNKYLAAAAPWKALPHDRDRAATVLYLSMQLVAHLALLGEPFMPAAARQLAQMLGRPELAAAAWPAGSSSELLPAGHVLPAAQLLFEKILP